MPHESTATPTGPVDPSASVGVSALSPAERSRLRQCFQRGTQNAPTNLDYAADMFAICVVGDPSNAVYLQGLLGVLKRKHAGKKGLGLSGLFSAGSRSALKKHAAAAQWRDVIKQGVEIVKANPADHACLLAMAEACGNLMYLDAQGVYLRAALDAAPADPEVNRQCARFAANQGLFDQAIECWRRISKVKGLGEEADREIARLSVEKTIVAGHGMTGRPGTGAGTTAPKPDSGAAAGPAAGGRVAELKEQIRTNPTAIDAYLELADLLERDATVEEAEKVLARALEVSGNDLKVQEHVEDRHLRWARHKVMLAEKRLEAGDTPEGRALVERLKVAQLKREIDIYSARCTRYPENVIWKYELAMRLKAAGNFTEAIRYFQEVLQDARRKGAVSLELGECFQKIRQYQLAMQSYQAAVESLTDRELELRKRALYRAGVLATGLEDPDSARKYLAMLAALDFNYRDVAQRLDNLGTAKDNSVSKPDG
ncbi:MAG: tetratricopeptide repeat protein [Planctomycetaceae bacterium]